MGHTRDRTRRLVTTRAALEGLTKRLGTAWKMVQKDGRLTKENMKEPLKEVRRALLEADVSLPVVRRFVKRVEEEVLGMEVTEGVSPEQQLIKAVYDQLKDLMGGEQALLNSPAGGDPQVILMAGLQGTGKTTATGKLANFLKTKNNQKVLLVATDVYRPAAVDQLVTVGASVDVPVFELGTDVKPTDIAAQGLAKAKAEGYDAVIIDTAGRLQIDENMMQELKDLKQVVNPTDVLLVVDAMTGQEAATLVKSFDEAVSITGAILTKTDGDTRGGAALSVKEVSGRPIKFVGTGEKMDAMEPFYPDRMASRILGMGDVVSLVEKAEAAIKEEEAAEMTKKIMSAKFDFNDFLKQYKMVTGMGSMSQIVKMIPGMGSITDKQLARVEQQYKVYEAMINSMTKQERAQPELLAKSPSRRRRVARGSGKEESDVAELVGVFTGMRAQMQTMSRMMAISGGTSGLMGMPGMDDEEMMSSLMGGAGPRPVAPGRIRRKKKIHA
ncbi:Signal recognition particle 54 kDa protein [Picochlorum sp. SENEW3]|nr:Signal recognition particle 54 kDa protein [Picochlorum sp. SENEW3]WPT14587.1 Signal recognition particle 54 kDa protein [Picochlorum sp. SENEW3]